MPENLVTLGVESRAHEVDYSSVIRAALHGETAQPGAFQQGVRFLWVLDVLPLVGKGVYGRMLFELHDEDLRTA
jgi:hypothetical protein